MDVAHIEKAEAELNNFIERRAKAASKAEAEEDLWRASVRRHEEREKRIRDAERYRWHADQAERLRRTMTQLVDHHERQARKLLEGAA